MQGDGREEGWGGHREEGGGRRKKEEEGGGQEVERAGVEGVQEGVTKSVTWSTEQGDAFYQMQ